MAIERRTFLCSAAVGTLALLPLPAPAQDAVVTLVADPTDPVTNSEPGRWAAGELRSAIRARGIDVQEAASVSSASNGSAGGKAARGGAEGCAERVRVRGPEDFGAGGREIIRLVSA